MISTCFSNIIRETIGSGQQKQGSWCDESWSEVVLGSQDIQVMVMHTSDAKVSLCSVVGCCWQTVKSVVSSICCPRVLLSHDIFSGGWEICVRAGDLCQLPSSDSNVSLKQVLSACRRLRTCRTKSAFRSIT